MSANIYYVNETDTFSLALLNAYGIVGIQLTRNIYICNYRDEIVPPVMSKRNIEFDSERAI